jgi:hypothetical protein
LVSKTRRLVDETEGLYVVQIKQRLPGFEQRPLHLFITYGVVGYYAHVVQREVESGNGQQARGFSYSEIEDYSTN